MTRKAKTEPRKIKVVSIDGDGCLWAYKNGVTKFHSSWDTLGLAYGLQNIWAARLQDFIGKDRDYEWTALNVAELTGKPVEPARRFLFPLPYSSGVREFAAARDREIKCGLLSASVDFVAELAKAELGFDFAYCNVLHRNNGNFTGTFEYRVPLNGKSSKIAEICEQFNVVPEQICHVGDSFNDLKCFEQVGLAVAFEPKSEQVAQAADLVISDFRELNRIFGAS
jgi:phosphoserine phosphatase